MKKRLKIIVDALMTLGLLLLMGFQFWGDAAHEWIGAGMFVLFIAHHILNIGWWRGLFKGRYTPARVLVLMIDVLTLAAMLGLIVSGVILSSYVFDFLPIKGKMSFARLTHMLSSYWGFVLMSLHLGLHWGALVGRFKFHGKLPALLGGAAAAYGIYAFFKRDLPTYLLLKTHFVFMDYGESKIFFYLDYLAIMSTFIFLSHYGAKLLKRWKARKEP